MPDDFLYEKLRNQVDNLGIDMAPSEGLDIEKLNEMLASYRNLFNNAQVGLFRASIEDSPGILECNKRMAEIYGYASPEDFVKHSQPMHLKHFQEEDWQRIWKDLQEQGHLDSHEVRATRRDGKVIWTLFSCKLVADKNWIEGVVEDITALKNVQQRLLDLEDRYNKLFYESPDAITLSDLKTGEIIECNDSTLTLSGYRREEVLGLTTEDILRWVDPRDRMEMVRQLQTRGSINNMETAFYAKDGRELPALLSARIMVLGERKCILATTRDISIYKEIEAERAKIDKLQSATTLAGGIAHDFNNLLAVIMGNIEMAQALQPHDERSSKLLKSAYNECERARLLTQKFLTISEGMLLDRESRQISGTVEDLVHQYLEGRNVSCEIDVTEGICEAVFDVQQMRYVITNLLDNAVEAMPGGGRINIRMHKSAAPDRCPTCSSRMDHAQYIKLCISDEGHGISSQDLPRIFDPYFSTKPMGAAKGMGLGLTIVESIVRKHDGHIFVDSTEGKGTTVTVYLPCTGR